MDAPAPTGDPAPADPPLRGLVVQTGRGAGGCLPLRAPVTLVGRAAGCDVRVEAQTVRALHCLLAPGPDGVALRTLHADDVQVNGRPATTAVLRDGDLLDVGPCRFRLRWPAPAAGTDGALEAMRIQVAAVVAQQAALTEQELRLRDRESALTRQEEQLAAHLEEKRRQLLELQDQITEARAALRQKRAVHAAMAEQQANELAQARTNTADLLSEAKAERQRLLTLRRRMKRRWHRHWLAQRQEIDAQAADLQRERQRLAAGRAALVAEAERFHGQAELGKRQLREDWAQLREERQAWQSEQAESAADRQQQTRDLARRAKAVAAAERQLADGRTANEQALADRRRELEHLEARIGNARRKLLEQQAEALRPEQATAAIAAPDFPPAIHRPDADSEKRTAALERRGAVLARVADELADQRLHLAEQAERLLLTHQAWCAERAAVTQELEQLGGQFQQRERELDGHDRDLQAAHGRLQGESEALAFQRLRLEAERVRADVRDADRRAELDRLQSALDTREQMLAQREAKCLDLYRLWGRRRRQEVRQLRTDQEACRQERAEWAAARAVWLRACEKLREERRAVTAQALAVEQSRQEYLGQAGPESAAAKRLERLQRQWAAYCAGAARQLERLRATVGVEAARIDERSRRTRQEQLSAAVRAVQIDDRAAEVERAELRLAAERAKLAEQVARELLAREQAERRSAELRDEVERLARLLIDAPTETAVPRAA